MAKKTLSPLDKMKRIRNILISSTSVLGAGTITSSALAIYYANLPRGGTTIASCVKGGNTLIETNDELTKTDSSAWVLYDNDIEVTDATWRITVSPVIGASYITLSNDHKIVCKNVPQGSYVVSIEATKDSIKADAKMSVVSYSAKSESVVITDAPDVLRTTESYECKAQAFPTTSSPTLVWSVDSWTGSNDTKPTFTANKFVTKNGEGEATIKVTDTTSSKTATKKITVNYPYRNSDKVWAYTTWQPGSTEWVWFDMDNLTTSGSTIAMYKMDDTKIMDMQRAGFLRLDLVIGDDLTAVPDNFCIDITAFVGTVTFSAKSKCSMIGSCFMQGCTGYASKLELPDTIRMIDDGFLDGCTSFNNGGEATFKMPSSLTTIGESFLNECTSFNSAITISENVAHVGASFMTNCDSMVSTITLNVDPNGVFAAHGSAPDTLSTNNESATCYKTGITVTSSTDQYVTNFKSLFPERAKSETIIDTFRHYAS